MVTALAGERSGCGFNSGDFSFFALFFFFDGNYCFLFGSARVRNRHNTPCHAGHKRAMPRPDTNKLVLIMILCFCLVLVLVLVDVVVLHALLHIVVVAFSASVAPFVRYIS
jgi:hypothetical protein